LKLFSENKIKVKPQNSGKNNLRNSPLGDKPDSLFINSLREIYSGRFFSIAIDSLRENAQNLSLSFKQALLKEKELLSANIPEVFKDMFSTKQR